MKAFRGALYISGSGLIVWALIMSFLTDWFWALAIVGAMVLIAAGLSDRGANDCGYRDTVFGGQAAAFDEIAAGLAEFRGVWPHEAGAPE